MKILWGVESLTAATTRYRVVIPSRPLRRKGFRIEVVETVNKDIFDNFQYDLVCLQRNSHPDIFRFLESLKAIHCPVIYDIDDDLFNIEVSSPVYNLYMQRPDIAWRQIQAMRFSDGVTVSTEHLTKVYWGVNPVIEAVPNGIDITDWMDNRIPTMHFGDSDSTVLVWEGSETHADSLALIVPVLERILLRFPKVLLAFVGLTRLPLNTLPKERTFCFGWGSYANMQSILLAAKIGLAPLAPSRFNLAKSNLRIMEYACAGLAIVGSPHGEYTEAITQAGGFLCKNEAEWETNLTQLIEHEELRRLSANRAREWVLGFDVNNSPSRWLNAWERMMPA